MLGGDERVGLAASGRDGALCDTCGAVHDVAVDLVEAVPVHRGSVVLEVVCYCHIDPVTPVYITCQSS